MNRLQRIAQRAKRNPCRPLDSEMPELVARYQGLVQIDRKPHDRFVHICIEQAFLAVNGGSFGIGAVIVNRHARVLQRSRARVLQPYLRTDLHAEMYGLTQLEERYRFRSRNEVDQVLAGSMLISSLEPCPMCFTRWILSGVSKIFYAAAEPMSGMAQAAQHLPKIWLEIIAAGSKQYGPADCSAELSLFCQELFARSQRAGGGPSWQYK